MVLLHRVFRALRAYVLAPLVWCCAPHAPPAVTPAAPVPVESRALTYTVALEHENHDVYCGGTWISRMFVLTANHCVADEDQDHIHLELFGGDRAESYVLRSDPAHDLAILLARDAPKHAFTHVTGTWRQGEPLTILGHPDGEPWVVLHGWLAKPVNLFDTSMLWVQAPIWFGNSGGGAFNAKGELVGVCSRLGMRVPDQALYIAPDEIAAFLGF